MPGTCPIKKTPTHEELPFRDDRARAFQMLHDAGPISLSDQGVYLLTSADAVETAAKNPEVFSSRDAFGIVGGPVPLVPLGFDPPESTRYRRMLDKFFSPRSMEERAPALRTQLAALIDEIITAGDTCEFVSALAIPFPSQVFLTLLGLPLEDRDRFMTWKDAILQFTDPANPEPTPEVVRNAAEMFSYLTSTITARRDNNGTDLLSQLLGDREDGGMTEQEILGLCFIIVIGGLDTVTASVGFAICSLAQDADRRQKVMDSPDALAEFIEESLRVDNPVLYAPRKTTTAVTIEGVMIPAGSSCMLSYAAANRDPQRFEAADQLQDERSNHFTFGRGPHRCLGSHLARLELRLVLEEWHKRVPNYEITPGTVPRVSWPNGTLTLEKLDLTLR